MPFDAPFVPGHPRVYTASDVDLKIRQAVGGASAAARTTVNIASGAWTADTASPVREGDTWQKGVLAHGLGSPDAALVAAWDDTGLSYPWLTWYRYDVNTIYVWLDTVPAGTITFKVIA